MTLRLDRPRDTNTPKLEHGTLRSLYVSAPRSSQQKRKPSNKLHSQNAILKALITATTPSTPNTPPPFRFTVNSTIVQQGLIDKSSAADGSAANTGKRGMHSASGAYWDVNRDGMWTFKYPAAEAKGLDVVVSVTWFALG